jgi:hypothetical protein
MIALLNIAIALIDPLSPRPLNEYARLFSSTTGYFSNCP